MKQTSLTIGLMLAATMMIAPANAAAADAEAAAIGPYARIGWSATCYSTHCDIVFTGSHGATPVSSGSGALSVSGSIAISGGSPGCAWTIPDTGCGTWISGTILRGAGCAVVTASTASTLGPAYDADTFCY